eukprot:939033-Pleurochrysis_carterae.AAC.1
MCASLRCKQRTAGRLAPPARGGRTRVRLVHLRPQRCRPCVANCSELSPIRRCGLGRRSLRR